MSNNSYETEERKMTQGELSSSSILKELCKDGNCDKVEIERVTEVRNKTKSNKDCDFSSSSSSSKSSKKSSKSSSSKSKKSSITEEWKTSKPSSKSSATLERACILSSLPSCAKKISSSESRCQRRQDCYDECDGYRPYIMYKQNCNNSEACGFKAMITPMTGLKSTTTTDVGMVPFLMRRKNKVVTLQWGSFTGQIGANGIPNVSVLQSITNLPPYSVEFPIRLIYNGIAKVGFLKIDITVDNQIQFWFDISGSSSGVAIGDTLTVPSSSVSWITA